MLSDDDSKVTAVEYLTLQEGLSKSIDQTVSIYNLEIDQFRDFVEDKTVSVNAGWIDYENLLAYAEQKGWFDFKALSVFQACEEMRDYFGELTPYVVRYANLIRANAANIQFFGMVNAGYTEVDLDESGRPVYRSTGKAESEWLTDLVARTIKAMEEHNAG